jgi:hypothetical protein
MTYSGEGRKATLQGNQGNRLNELCHWVSSE